jgi:hypothetical protein
VASIPLRAALVLAALAALPADASAQTAGSARPDDRPIPAPPAASPAPPSGRVPGPAVQAGGGAPGQADYYRQAAKLYRDAAAKCPPRAACYQANAEYHECLARSLGAGGACAAPSCSTTTPECTSGGGANGASATARPASGGGVPQAVGQGFSAIAGVLQSIEAERAQREAHARRARELQQMRADQLLDKWRIYTEELRAMRADPESNRDFLLSPEHASCPDACVEYDAENVYKHLQNRQGGVAGNLHQDWALKEEPRMARQVAAMLDAWHRYKDRVTREAIERQVRRAQMAARTTPFGGTPAPVVRGARDLYLVSRTGTPVWQALADDGRTVDLATTSGGAPRIVLHARALAAPTTDGVSAYWIEGDAIWRAPLAGGEPSVLVRQAGTAALMVDDREVWWMWRAPSASRGALYRMPKSGGAGTFALPTTDGLQSALVGATVFGWTSTTKDARGEATLSSVIRPKSGGADVAVTGALTAIAETNGRRFVALSVMDGMASEDRIAELDASGTAQPVLRDLGFVGELVAIGGQLYWSESPIDASFKPLPGSIKRMDLATGAISLLADNLHGTPSFTVDGDTLWYAEGGTSEVDADGKVVARHADAALWRLALAAEPPGAAAAGQRPKGAKR